MNFAVAIVCLTIVVSLGEVTASPTKQQVVKNQSQITDGVRIFLREDEEPVDLDLNLISPKEKVTKLRCKFAGGKCKPKDKPKKCHGGNGLCLEGKSYCKFDNIFCCCVPPPRKGCVWGATSYPDKSFLPDSCLRMQCLDGKWNLVSDVIDPECGQCSAYPIATIDPFNKTSYIFNETGYYYYDFVQTNYDVWHEIHLGVGFGSCYDYGIVYSCVESFRYYDYWTEVQITPADPFIPSADEVEVGYATTVTMTNDECIQLQTPRGSVWVYKKNPLIFYLHSYTGLSVRIWRELCIDVGCNTTETRLDAWISPWVQTADLYGLCFSDTKRSNGHQVADKTPLRKNGRANISRSIGYPKEDKE